MSEQCRECSSDGARELAERRVVEDDVRRNAASARERQPAAARSRSNSAASGEVSRRLGSARACRRVARLVRLPIEHALDTPAQQVGARAGDLQRRILLADALEKAALRQLIDVAAHLDGRHRVQQPEHRQAVVPAAGDRLARLAAQDRRDVADAPALSGARDADRIFCARTTGSGDSLELAQAPVTRAARRALAAAARSTRRAPRAGSSSRRRSAPCRASAAATCSFHSPMVSSRLRHRAKSAGEVSSTHSAGQPVASGATRLPAGSARAIAARRRASRSARSSDRCPCRRRRSRPSRRRLRSRKASWFGARTSSASPAWYGSARTPSPCSDAAIASTSGATGSR